jgi:S1-C subfamily serine protease
MRRFFVVALLIAFGFVSVACSNGTGAGAFSHGTPTSGTTASPADTTPPPLAVTNPNNDPVVQVVKRVQPAVVNVVTNLFQETAFGQQEARGVGTGFIVRSDGTIVTNFHVVEGAQRITVIVGTPPSVNVKRFPARVIGGDQGADLAVLKINAGGLPTVPLGNSSGLELGERVVALGYALALQGGPTVTSGIVSALNRVVRASDPNFHTRTYTHVIQTDAAINPGNSGGPLVNLAGQVVGINTAGAQQAENIGFAIAIDAAKPTIDEAIAHPSAPVAFLGVTTQDVTGDLQFQLNLPVNHGAFVVAVAPKGPAQAAGIRNGDVIVAFGGSPVNTSDDLLALIQRHKPGDRSTVEVVLPNGSRKTVTATLGVRPLPVTTR